MRTPARIHAAVLTFPLAVTGCVAGLALSPAASAVATTRVTRYAPQVTNVRSGPATTYAKVGSLATGTKVTGTLSGGWVKISSPSNFAGRYVSDSVLKPVTVTTPAPPSPVSSTAGTAMWTGYRGYKVYASASTSSTVIATLPVNFALRANPSGTVWAKITSGQYAGRYILQDALTPDDPKNPPTGNAALPSSRAAQGVKVSRWVEGYSNSISKVVVRTAPSLAAKQVATIASGGGITGEYVNYDWFKITSGTYAGKYVSAALLMPANPYSKFNCNMPKADLCALPSEVNNTWEPETPRLIDCTAAKNFNAMNTAFKKKFGYSLSVDETYRSLAKQQFYYAMKGPNIAAKPGTSNHGFAVAIDFEGQMSAQVEGRNSPYVWGASADRWLQANSHTYGFDRPAYLNGREYWHYNFIG